MANTNAPKGAVPVRQLDGSPWNGATRMYLVPSADGTAVFVGDFVKTGGTAGAAGLLVNGVNCEGMGTAIQAAAGDTNIVGVVCSFLPNPTALDTKHRAASTNRIALVCDSPDVIFEIQEDSLGAALAAVDVGENADIVVSAGSATTGLSGMQLDSSTHTSGAANLRILGYVNRSGNEIGDYAKMMVLINEHAYKTTSGV